MIRRPPRSTLFPYHDALPICLYEAVRDRLSSDLFDVTESIASYDWDLAEVRTLLRGISHATSDEVDLLHNRTKDRKSTRLNSSHANISYAVFCLKNNNPSTLP